ncbi:fibronectin type III domain-containing protein [Chitinophaga sp. Hz27]|uniref:fibronectin type III domain-containing protein n=1 Tax=Chitinophaga sp. Hz27 TaxID=3347169 RepID=UPI0035E142F4
MPVTAIIAQPSTGGLSAAYRPVIYRINAMATNEMDQAPIVWCDIYFGGVYYKSLSSTIYSAPGEWQFDIQNAAQEYLRAALAPNGSGNIFQSAKSLTKVFCRFRASGYNQSGITIPEGTIPIQATGMSPAQPGTGLQSYTSYIVNSALLHEDNQDILTHLTFSKTGIWSPLAFPLTHRPRKYNLAIQDSDYFPIVYTGTTPIKCIQLNFRLQGQSNYQQRTKCWPFPCPQLSPVLQGIMLNPDTTQTITIGWQSLPVYVSGVKVQYRKTGSSTPWTAVTLGAVSYWAVTLPLGKYDFMVSATGDCTEVDPGVLMNVGENRNPCQPITGLIVTRVTADTWRITWNPVAGSSGYIVSYQINNGPSQESTVTTNSYTFVGVLPGDTYKAVVYNLCNPGASDPSAEVTFTAPQNFTFRMDAFKGAVSTYCTEYKLGSSLFAISNTAGRISGAGSWSGANPALYRYEATHSQRDATVISLHLFSSNSHQIVGNYEVYADGTFIGSANVNTPNNSWLNIPVNLLDVGLIELKLNF